MDIKDAAQHAKRHIAELFTDEDIQNIGLEEIEFDGLSGVWRVTVGFSRPWDRVKEPPYASVEEIIGAPRKRVRDMKVVAVDDIDGRILSVKNRE
jgi:hypothetical protein